MEVVLFRAQKTEIKENMNSWISGQNYERNKIFRDGNGWTPDF